MVSMFTIRACILFELFYNFICQSTEKSARRANVSQRNMISRVWKRLHTNWLYTAYFLKIPPRDTSVTTSVNWRKPTRIRGSSQSMLNSMHGFHRVCNRVWWVCVTLELSSPQFICKREQNYLKLFEPVALRSDMRDISVLYHISVQHIFKMKGDERKFECQLHKYVNGIIIQFLLTLTKYHFSFLTPNILLVLLLTVCHTILIMSVWRIWYWIN